MEGLSVQIKPGVAQILKDVLGDIKDEDLDNITDQLSVYIQYKWKFNT